MVRTVRKRWNLGLDTNNHAVFLLHDHLVMVVKYRKRVITDEMSQRLARLFKSITQSCGITVPDANSLANSTEWHIRHFRSRAGEYLSYEKNNTTSRQNHNYRMLQANCAQQVLRKQDKRHQSYLCTDEGIDNFVAGVLSDGTTFLVDGRRIKAINCYHNMRKAGVQSELRRIRRLESSAKSE